MVEEGGEQTFFVNSHGCRVNCCGQLLVRGRNEISQINVFHLVPTRLDRVQLGGVRGKVFKRKPTRVRLLEIRIRRMMGWKMIPKHQHLVAKVMVKFREIKHEILESRRSLEDRETKF